MAKRKSPGRPPGSRNREYAIAVEIPACCVKCGSTKLKRVEGSKTIEHNYSGTLPSGFRFRGVRVTRKRCECGQVLCVRSYLPVLTNERVDATSA